MENKDKDIEFKFNYKKPREINEPFAEKFIQDLEQKEFIYKCENCNNTKEKTTPQVLILCGCGYEMKLIKQNKNKKW